MAFRGGNGDIKTNLTVRDGGLVENGKVVDWAE